MTFGQYVKNSTVQDTPRGDFLEDARRDKNFPDATSWREIRNYLESVGACYEALEAAYDVWCSYRKYKLRHRTRQRQAIISMYFKALSLAA